MVLKPGVNPYQVLGLEQGCTEKDIQKAYRTQCLKWHPDKNLNNKEEAQKRFIEAKDAFEFLYDETNRKEYDAREARIAAAAKIGRERKEKADGNRKRFIDELEKRESEAAENIKRAAKNPAAMSPAQHARKKKEFQQEMERVRQQMEKEAADEVKRQLEDLRNKRNNHNKNHTQETTSDDNPKLKIKWKLNDDKKDYTEEKLRKIFQQFGKVLTIVIIPKEKRRNCVIEFENDVNLWGAELETGESSYPELKGEWMKQPMNKVEAESVDYATMNLDDLEALLP